MLGLCGFIGMRHGYIQNAFGHDQVFDSCDEAVCYLRVYVFEYFHQYADLELFFDAVLEYVHGQIVAVRIHGPGQVDGPAGVIDARYFFISESSLDLCSEATVTTTYVD